MTTAMLPGLAAADEWFPVKTSNPTAVALANRHYSRRRVGQRIGGPWKCLALLTGDGAALWLSTYTVRPMDGLDAVRCSIFRNEGPVVSSALIRSAMDITEREWRFIITPPDGWVTWVNSAEVATEIPGYCFRRAGWKRDRSYAPGRRRPTIVRFRARWRGDNDEARTRPESPNNGRTGGDDA